MKLNQKQIYALESIQFLVSCWSNTNDINSPTIGSDINEEMDKLYYDEILSEEEIDGIVSDLSDLLNKIRKLK